MKTKPISKSKLIAKIISVLLALSMTACSLAPAATPSPSAPIATEPPATPTEIPVELDCEIFSPSESFPEEFMPYVDAFSDMALKDGLDITEMDSILWFKAAQGELSVNYALLQIAVVTDIKDADGQPSNPKPVYYIAYQDEQGQMQSGYALGKLIEKDDKGVSYVTRVLDEQTFRNWQNDTQPEDGSYTVGQIVHYIPLREDINVPQARTTQAKLNSGELSSEEFMQNYAEGVGFIQPGQEDQLVGVDKPTPEELNTQPFWKDLFSGVTAVQAAGLEELSATAIVEPTPTTEPIPTLSPELTGGIEGIPDPKISNPELFDLTKKDAPIPQFVNTMKMAGIEVTREEVLSGLRLELETPQNLPPFITYRTEDGVALLMSIQDSQTGEWKWQVATLGEYWNSRGKWLGISAGGEFFNYDEFKDLVGAYFSGGILSLAGIVRPGPDIQERKPINALDAFILAQKNDMSLNFHYIAEPDKFPTYVNTSNVDEWLQTRLVETAQLAKRYKSKKPIMLVFNEGFDTGRNPLKDKYKNEWPSEYIYQVLVLFIKEGMIPNKDFIIQFNEGDLFSYPDRQVTLFNTLVNARKTAYSRLLEEYPEFADILYENNIKSEDDIKVFVGAETHVVQGKGTRTYDGIQFERAPSLDEVNTLANSFATLGGVILTEINPFGATDQDKANFLRDINVLLNTNPNLRGAILWNILDKRDRQLVFSQSQAPKSVFDEILPLFNDARTPSILYYQLLR